MLHLATLSRSKQDAEDSAVDPGPANPTALQGLLGYLHFSAGRPDPRAQAQLFGLWKSLGPTPPPWDALRQTLDGSLAALQAGGNAAFRDTRQAQAVVELALGDLPRLYRSHHADLLFHRDDA